jgi:hypothetical protein
VACRDDVEQEPLSQEARIFFAMQRVLAAIAAVVGVAASLDVPPSPSNFSSCDPLVPEQVGRGQAR